MRSLFNKNCVKHKKGFTLFEILTVLIIFIVLVSVAAPIYNKAVNRGRVSDGLKVLKMLENAQEKYFIHHGHYAARLTDLNVPIKELRGQDPDSSFTDIITTHFTYNKIPLQHCIYATPNKAKQNYTLVKNYKTKAKVRCVGDGCDAISGLVKKADEISTLCPAAPEGCTLTEEYCRKHKNSYLDPVKCECVPQAVTPSVPSGNDCSKEGSVRFVNSGERCSGNRGESTPSGTPSLYITCGIRFDEQTCKNGYWVNTGNYDCRQKTCGEGSGQVLNLETCECDTYKNCDPITKPSCSYGITVCDPCPESPSIPNIIQQALMEIGGGNEKGEHPSNPSLSTECFHCGYKNSATTATCNHTTGSWYCAGDENVGCTQINGSIPLYNGSCDGNGTAGNACGGYKLTNVRCWQEITGGIPELSPQYSTSCSLKTGNACFSGETRACTLQSGGTGVQKCKNCQWDECTLQQCPVTPNPTGSNKRACNNGNPQLYCGTQIAVAKCDASTNYRWVWDFDGQPCTNVHTADRKNCPRDSFCAEQIYITSCTLQYNYQLQQEQYDWDKNSGSWSSCRNKPNVGCSLLDSLPSGVHCSSGCSKITCPNGSNWIDDHRACVKSETVNHKGFFYNPSNSSTSNLSSYKNCGTDNYTLHNCNSPTCNYGTVPIYAITNKTPDAYCLSNGASLNNIIVRQLDIHPGRCTGGGQYQANQSLQGRFFKCVSVNGTPYNN